MKRRVTSRIERAQDALNEIERKIERAAAIREQALKTIVRTVRNLDEFYSIRSRIKKRIDRLKAERIEEAHERAAELPNADVTIEEDLDKLVNENTLDIPDFLSRDAQAKRDIAEEIRQQKKRKEQGRAIRRQAERSGATKRMPASGRAAIRIIDGA